MRCVVLSGATVPFKELVQAVDADLVRSLGQLGFTELYVQYGHARAQFSLPDELDGVRIHAFDFTPQIRELVSTASLVISHAGSGSILDALERGGGNAQRRVVVVVNDKLMDNHQIELASKLESVGCIAVAYTPKQLPEKVDAAFRRQFARLDESNSIQYIIDAERTHSV